MLLCKSLLVFFTIVLLPLCRASAPKILPRVPHLERRPAYVELHDVVVKATENPNVRPRIYKPTKPSQKILKQKQSAAAAVKRVLLASRQQYCDAGYGYCYASGYCCPDANDSGACCDDGTCITSTQECCLSGSACDTGLECCEDGCMDAGNTCCYGGGSCDPGEQCCNDGCAPEENECCSDGSSCQPGLHCVLYDGVLGCCEDLSCSGGGGGIISYSYTVPDFSYTPITIPSFTLPSYTPITVPSFTIPTFTIPTFTAPTFTVPTFTAPDFTPPSISIPSITLPSTTTLISPTTITTAPTSTTSTSYSIRSYSGAYSYYYTIWYWSYYYYFLTTIRIITSTTTSTLTSTSTTVSCTATARAQAASVFASLSSETTFFSRSTAREILAGDTGGVASSTSTVTPFVANPTTGSSAGGSNVPSAGRAAPGSGVTWELLIAGLGVGFVGGIMVLL